MEYPIIQTQMSKRKAFLVLGIISLTLFLFFGAASSLNIPSREDYESISGTIEKYSISKWWEEIPGTHAMIDRFQARVVLNTHPEIFKYNFEVNQEKDSAFLQVGLEATLTIKKGRLGKSKPIWVNQIDLNNKKIGSLEKDLKNDRVARPIGAGISVLFGISAYLLLRLWIKEKKNIEK